MKKILFTMLLPLLTVASSFAQYYDNDPVGTKYEYEITNPLLGKMSAIYKLIAVDDNTLTYEVTTTMPGADEPSVAVNKLTMSDGKLIIDMESVINETKNNLGTSLGTTNMEVEIEGETGYTPLQGKKGDKLPLHTYTATVNTQGMTIVNKIEVQSNEIVEEEKVTLPAGEFETFVQALDTKSTIEVMGQKQSFSQTQKTWIVPNKGVVKLVQSSMGQEFTTTLVKITRP